MKKITKFLTIALTASFAIPFAACSQAPVSKTSTSPNWNVRVASNDLNDTSEWLTKKEVSSYKVSFTAGKNASYKVVYDADSATYSTELYAIRYDWNSTSIPEEFRKDETEIVYAYETHLFISGKYVYGSEEYPFSDSVETIAYFHSADKQLAPVYSKRTIKNCAPNTYSPSSLSTAYVKLDRAYETYYNQKATKAIVTCDYGTDDEATKAFTQKIVKTSTSNILFDAAYIGVGVRSLAQSGTQSFNLFIDANSSVSAYRSAFSSAKALDETKDADIISALDASLPSDYIFVGNNAEGKPDYKATQANVSYTAELAGATNSYRFASITSKDLNSARAVLLQVTTPVQFGLGELVYTLNSLSLVNMID